MVWFYLHFDKHTHTVYSYRYTLINIHTVYSYRYLNITYAHTQNPALVLDLSSGFAAGFILIRSRSRFATSRVRGEMDVDEDRGYYDDGGRGRRGGNRGGGGARHHPYGNDERGGRRRDDAGHNRGGGGRGGGRGRGRRDDGALSFRDFCYKYLREDATPAEAERRYEEYQKENQEAFFDRYFRDHRHDENERARNDPRVLVETLRRRDEVSVKRAGEFFAARASGVLDVYASAGAGVGGDGDEDAEMEVADGGEDAGQQQQQQHKRRSLVPIEAWQPSRLGHDLKQSAKLILRLDAEKGIEGNPLVEGEDAGMDVEDAAAEDAATLEALGNEEGAATRLDERLCYLLRVHGLDYYKRCSEMNPVTFLENVTMQSSFTQRDAKPESGVAAMAENPYAVRWSAALDGNVKRRIAEGDPQVKKLGTEEIERKLEEWIQSCVVKHDEQRFGTTLSSKLFIAEEFVIKHIKTKQAHHVEDMRERLLDDQYRRNVIEFLKLEQNRKANRKNKKRFGGNVMMMMQMPGASENAPFVPVPAGAMVEGAKAIQMKRYTDLDASVGERVVIDYGDI